MKAGAISASMFVRKRVGYICTNNPAFEDRGTDCFRYIAFIGVLGEHLRFEDEIGRHSTSLLGMSTEHLLKGLAQPKRIGWHVVGFGCMRRFR